MQWHCNAILHQSPHSYGSESLQSFISRANDNRTDCPEHDRSQHTPGSRPPCLPTQPMQNACRPPLVAPQGPNQSTMGSSTEVGCGPASALACADAPPAEAAAAASVSISSGFASALASFFSSCPGSNGSPVSEPAEIYYMSCPTHHMHSSAVLSTLGFCS